VWLHATTAIVVATSRCYQHGQPNPAATIAARRRRRGINL